MVLTFCMLPVQHFRKIIMPRRVKTTSPTFIIEPYKNIDTGNGINDNQREQQLPFVFGITGKPSLRHAPTRKTA